MTFRPERVAYRVCIFSTHWCGSFLYIAYLLSLKSKTKRLFQLRTWIFHKNMQCKLISKLLTISFSVSDLRKIFKNCKVIFLFEAIQKLGRLTEFWPFFTNYLPLVKKTINKVRSFTVSAPIKGAVFIQKIFFQPSTMVHFANFRLILLFMIAQNSVKHTYFR